MFGRLREPGGGPSLLMAGIAALALAGFLLLTPLPAPVGPVLAVLAGAAGAALIITWAVRRRAARYDLSRLWDSPPPIREEPEEPERDTIPDDEEAAPYCGWCDEANPPGSRRCLRCGRAL